jgi:hypothetical protein
MDYKWIQHKDINYHIFTLLHPLELINLRLISRHFNNLLNNEVFWKNRIIHFFGDCDKGNNPISYQLYFIGLVNIVEYIKRIYYTSTGTEKQKPEEIIMNRF